ncbi:MAG: BCCT family transporter [Spirochaeta sp.]|jgi:glycine betaine transporter|nr:BCCT family transporter [Spirochaeta sp.]
MKRPSAVFVISVILVLTFVVFGAVAPAFLDTVTSRVHGAILTGFGWGYLLATFAFLVFAVYLAFGRYGSIKLGGDHEKPQYGYFGWFSMLFAAGMGIGLVFWGVAEPLQHFAQPPAYLAAESGAAARFAMVRSFFHWGVHPWAVYILMSLSIAYFSFRRGMPPLISSVFYPLIGDASARWPGKAIDILAVFATVFGVATSLGLGAMQIRGGLSAAFGTPTTTGAALVIIAVVTVLYMISSLTGLDKGIRILSSGNVIITLVLMGAVLVLGPTAYIFNIFTSTLGSYVTQLVDLSLSTNPFQGFEWTQDWTLFYWAWWISWSPFVGLFVASISRGRTIREFVSGALLVPTLLTFLWFAVFGGTALDIELNGAGGLVDTAVNDVSSALFVLLEALPGTMILTILALLVLGIFFITSADSATYVLAMMTTGGELRPPASVKIAWGLLQSSAAAVLLVAGGLAALQRMAIIAALPFTFVMLFMMRSLLKAMHYEVTHEEKITQKVDT